MKYLPLRKLVFFIAISGVIFWFFWSREQVVAPLAGPSRSFEENVTRDVPSNIHSTLEQASQSNSSEQPISSSPLAQFKRKSVDAQSRYFSAVGRRFEIHESELGAGYGAYVDLAVSSSDPVLAMKAAYILSECRAVAARTGRAFEAHHRGPNTATSRKLEDSQQLARRCQSLRAAQQAESVGLLSRALAFNEPTAASMLLEHFNRNKLAVPDDLKPLVAKGLEIDAIRGEKTSLMLLAMSGSQLGLSDIEVVAYELTWLAMTGRVNSGKLDDEKLPQLLFDFSNAATEAEKQKLAHEFLVVVMASSRPDLSPDDTRDVLKRSAQLVEKLKRLGGSDKDPMLGKPGALN